MMPLLMIAGLIALVWGISFLRFGRIQGILLAVLITGCVFGPAFFSVSVLSLDRALLGVAFVWFAVAWRTGLHDPKPIVLTDVVVFAWALALLANVAFHEPKYAENLPVTRLLFYYLLPISMYWLARQTAWNPGWLRMVYGVFACFGLYLAVTAVCEAKGMHSLVFPRYIVSPLHEEFFGRGRGPLLNPSGNGIYLSVCFASLLALWPRANKLGRIGIVFAALVQFAGFYATLTRCVWLAAAGIIMLMVAKTFPPQKRKVAVASLIVMGLVGVAIKGESLVRFKRDKNVSEADMAKSAELRPLLAYVAMQMFADHPIDGVGLGRYKKFDSPYLSNRNSGLVLENARPYVQHNVILSLMTETGLLGTVPFLVLLIHWTKIGLRLYDNRSLALEERQLGLILLCLLIGYLANGMFQDVSIIPMVHMLLMFFTGAATGLAVKRTVSHRSHGWQQQSALTQSVGEPVSV